MEDQERHPELTGYVADYSSSPRKKRRMVIIRTVVILSVIALVLPGVLTTISVASSTADAACATWVRYSAPDASEASARFELFGEGGIGWECYAIGAFGGDRHVASLGLIPGNAKLPGPVLNS